MKLKLIKEPATNTNFKREYYVNENNQLHGEYKQWWDNGQLWEHSYFKNDKLHGEYKAWWNNGQKDIHCYYINDKKYTWKEYKKMKIQKILSV